MISFYQLLCLGRLEALWLLILWGQAHQNCLTSAALAAWNDMKIEDDWRSFGLGWKETWLSCKTNGVAIGLRLVERLDMAAPGGAVLSFYIFFNKTMHSTRQVDVVWSPKKNSIKSMCKQRCQSDPSCLCIAVNVFWKSPAERQHELCHHRVLRCRLLLTSLNCLWVHWMQPKANKNFIPSHGRCPRPSRCWIFWFGTDHAAFWKACARLTAHRHGLK